MRSPALLVVLSCTALLGACGGGRGSSPRLDSGGSADGQAVGKPFVPLALELVIDSMLTAVDALSLPSSAKPPIAVLLRKLTGFWSAVVTGANRMGARLACPLVVEAPVASDASVTALQNQCLQGYIDGQVYRGVALAPRETDADSVAVLNRFVEQRGPVVTIDADSPTSKRSYNISSANYQAGYMVAALLRRSLSLGDTVLVFGTSDTSWSGGWERTRGAEEGAAAAGLILAPRVSTNFLDAPDVSALKASLSDPQLAVKGMLCLFANSHVCARAAEEVFGAPGVVKIVAFDMEVPTKAFFDKGYFVAVAVQRQYYMGQFGVLVPYCMNVLGAATTSQLLAPLLVDGIFIDTGIDIITLQNYADYMSFLSTLGINI